MTFAQMSSDSSRGVTVTLRRDLSLFDVTMIGVGSMIGTSVFVLIGVVIDEVGPAVLLVFLFNAIATTFTAATYAELGSTFPAAGGGYLWAKKAMRHPAAFLSGWMSWFGHTVACSFYALGFGYAILAISHSYGVDFFGLPDEAVKKLFAALAILFFVSVNYAGVGATGKAGDVVTMVQVIIITFFVAFAVIYALDNRGLEMVDNFTPIFPEGKGMSDVLMVMGFTFLAFEGYEIIVQSGEEVKKPKKNIPRAIFVSVVIATILYVSMAFACLINFDAEWIGGQGKNATIMVADMLIPHIGAPLLIAGSMLSAMAALNSTIFSSSRMSFAMGRDGSLPRMFGVVHGVRSTPYKAIAVTGTMMLFMALFFPLETVLAATSIMFLLLFCFANVALIKLRRRLTRIDTGFRTPLFPLCPVLGIVFSLAIAGYLWFYMPLAWYIAAGWIGLGLALSSFAKPHEEVESIVSRKRVRPKPLTQEEIARYRVFLALENLGDLRLVETAGILSRYFKGDLTVNKIVEVPRAMPLEAISKDYIDEVSASLKKTIKVVPSTVRVHPTVSVSYNVAGAIVDQTRHEAADLLVLGWKGTKRKGKTILGRNLDMVVREAPCDVAVIKTRRLAKNIENILLVSRGYVETRKALLLVLPIAKEYGAKVEILVVITDERQLELARGNAERLSKTCERVHVEHTINMVHSKSVVGTVMERARACDLLAMGTPPQSALERTMFGAVGDRIIRSVDVPVMVLRTSAPTGTELTPPPLAGPSHLLEDPDMTD